MKLRLKEKELKTMEIIFKEEFGEICYNTRFTNNKALSRFINGVLLVKKLMVNE